jgi:hypothetical protein
MPPRFIYSLIFKNILDSDYSDNLHIISSIAINMAVNIPAHLKFTNREMIENFNDLFCPVYNDTFRGDFTPDLLGTGAMGAVFACRLQVPQFGNQVAVKVGRSFLTNFI